MKVLKKGWAHIPWSTKVTCTHCSAELEIEAEDIYQAGGGHDDFYAAFTCPECLNQTEVERKHLPAGFRFADRRYALERAIKAST